MQPHARRSLQLAVLALPVVLFSIAGWSYRSTVDDGFIYMRVIQQIRAGNGPVFNAGERIEAFTSPLWLAVLWLASLLVPLRLEWLAVGLGIALSASGLVLALAGARFLVLRCHRNAFLVPFGALVPVALLPAWVFQTSGLESGLVLAWLGACLFTLARWAGSDRTMRPGAAAIIGLGWLVRPELALYSAVFLGAVVAMQRSRDTWAQRLRFLAGALWLPLSYQLFRMGFYGSLVANSAIAKDARSQNWMRGWKYLLDFAAPYSLWLPAVAIAAGGLLPLAMHLHRAGASRSLAVMGMLVAGGLLNGLYVVSVGGDWIHARLLLPPLFGLVLPVAAVPFARPYLVGVVLVP